MFVGLGSASHYLKEWFHPVAAFDSESDARDVFTKFFPEAVVTANFNNMLVEGDGEGTYKQAAKTARVAFCSPPCSSISVVNDARDESSAQARLVVDSGHGPAAQRWSVGGHDNNRIDAKLDRSSRREIIRRDAGGGGIATDPVHTSFVHD
jgi:hypothetical protein